MLLILLSFTFNSYFISKATTELQNETIGGYLYKLVLETNSDWTTVDILGGPLIIGYSYTIIQGLEAPNLRYAISPKFIWIGKKTSDTTLVRIDIEIIALKSGDATIIIKKGDIGSTKISIYIWKDGKYSLLFSIINEGINPKYPGTNERSFYLNLEQLYKLPSSTIVYQAIPKEIERCILAFYYPWYGTSYGPSKIWFHWEGISQDSIANAAHYPLLGIYDSQDEKLIEAHILLAKNAGIDGFIVSWWGINSFEDKSLEKIIKIAERYDFKISIYYESYRPWNPLKINEVINELSYVITKYSKSPIFLKVDERPVIFIYAIESHERKPEFWLQVRRSLEEKVNATYLIGDTKNPEYLHVFDGFHTYIELNQDDMKNTYIFYNNSMKVGLIGQDFSETIAILKSGNPIKIQEKILFYTIIPGYDDRKIRSPGNYIDRADGEIYRAFWRDALESGARHILITSWNELHEGTEIEPTREYVFLFLDITREYASMLKQESIEKILPPKLDIKPILNEGENELSIKLLNLGKGAIIATRIQIQYPPEAKLSLINIYQQPSKENFIIIIIPIIKEQEEYTLSLKFKELSQDKIILKITYYSTTGSAYSTDIFLATILRTSTTTLTNILTTTITSITTSTDKITETFISTMTTTTIQTIIPQLIIFTLIGLTIIVIAFSVILGYILIRKIKRT
jgi:hypothetical protein